MLGLFKSKRNKIKEKGEKAFSNCIPTLKGMDGSEIGFVLDQAVRIKYASTIFGSDEDALEIFINPMAVPETIAFGILEEWERHMISLAGSVEGRAKIGYLSIWYLSVIACQIGELRLKGREMWAELERGYQYTEIFDPAVDYVVCLEPMS